jgi:hypothetical protein
MAPYPWLKHKFKQGDVVKSRFKAPWKGIVQKVEKRKIQGKFIGDLVTVLLTHDRHGKPFAPNKRQTKTYDEYWFELVERMT